MKIRESVVILLFILFSFTGFSRSNVERSSVWILNSYHDGYYWSDRIMNGIRDVLGSGDSINMFVDYMDSKRCSDSIYFKQLSSLYAYKYKKQHFDAIITTDDNALQFMLQYHDRLFPGVPVAFCGINDFEPSMIAGETLYTGVMENYDESGTLQMVLDIHPETEKVIVINDGTVTGQLIINRFERVKDNFPVSLTYLSNLSREQIKDSLQKVNNKTIVIWSVYLRTRNEKMLTTRESVQMISQWSPVPVYCVWDVVGLGVVGGKVSSPFDQGSLVASMMLDILNGTNPQDISVGAVPTSYRFDYNVLDRFKIDEKTLPENSIIINRPFSFYKEYAKVIWTTIVIFILLIIIISILTFLNKRLRQAEDSLIVKNSELETQKEKLEHMNVDLKKARDEAQESNNLKTAFIANLGHEIRTPMNGIMGFANLLKKDNLSPDKQQRYVDVIKKSGNRMLNIINDLIDISRIEAGQVKVNISKVGLNTLMDSLYLFFLHQAEEKGLKLICEKGLDDQESVIETDKGKLEQVLSNLLRNAIKFTQHGEIVLSYEKMNGFLKFSVKDTGPGIEKENHLVIFERFRQAGKASATGEDGSGLGLAISQAFVEILGGEIYVDSQPGEGATFFFTLPYSKVRK